MDTSFIKNLESSIRFGNPLIIQDAESLDPIVNTILNKEIRRTGGRSLIRLGTQDIDFSPSFSMFLTTRDPSAVFPPDVCSRVTFANFTVTRSSLQSQCLHEILKSERPDVDGKRQDLLKLQGEYNVRLTHLEKSLLQALNESDTNILDDDNVISTLEVLKREAGEVRDRVAETEAVMKEVETVIGVYNPLADACSSIYFVLENMSTVSQFYQFSLAFFMDIFRSTLSRSVGSDVMDDSIRLDQLVRTIFQESFRRASLTLVYDDHVVSRLPLGNDEAQDDAQHSRQPRAHLLADSAHCTEEVRYRGGAARRRCLRLIG